MALEKHDPAAPGTIIHLTEEMGERWRQLIAGLALLSRAGGMSPTHCEHDTMTVCADPREFSNAELDQLDALGFFVPSRVDAEDPDHPVDRDDWEDYFTSYRFGSA